MLNYVWLGLILLGLAAAISGDLVDTASNRFGNGEELEALVSTPSEFAVAKGKAQTLMMTVPQAQFSKAYGIQTEEGYRGAAQFSFATDSSGSIYFKIPGDAPSVWQTIAGASGEENDISGTFTINSTSDGQAQVSVVLEEAGFINMKAVTNAALDYAEISVEIALGLIGIMAMWLGIMKIAEEAGVISYIAIALRPITKMLFPKVPQDHPAIGTIIMNLSATFLGLGNAATPFGIKAMEELDKLNDKKGTATNAMCTFLVLNTASFAMIPATAVAVRAAAGSSQPGIIIGTAMFGSFCATVAGVIAAKTFEKFPIDFSRTTGFFKDNLKKILITLGVIAALAALYAAGVLQAIAPAFSFLNPDLLKNVVQIISTVAIPLVIGIFVIFGFAKKVKIYDTFVEGAKEGFEIAVTIIPYLVAMLMAIGIFRAGGAMDWLVFVLRPVTDFIGMPVEALPMALMRPLSGSGSLGIMAEIISVHGPDSFIGILVSTFFGSTETTFYVLAVYFGAVNIKNTRHALPAGLISDVAGILAAIFIVRLLFG